MVVPVNSQEDPLTAPGPGYRWVALSNTTLGTLMVTVNGSITLIALPDWPSPGCTAPRPRYG